MALTNGLVAPWHRSAGNVYSLSFSVSFLFLFHPSFLRLFSSLALLFLLLFRGGLFTGFCFLSVLPLFLLLFFRLVAPLARFAMGNSLLLSLSLSGELRGWWRLRDYFSPVTQPAGASYLRETVAFHRGEGEKVGGINRGREFRFRGKPKTGELRVVIYDSSDGKTSEVLMSEVICFESCYALFRTGYSNFGRVSINFFFFPT